MMWRSGDCRRLALTLGTFVWVAPVSSWAEAPKRARDEAPSRETEELKTEYKRLYEEGKYDEATTTAKQACLIVKEIHGSESIEQAECFNDLGVFREMQGAYREAESLYTRALAIKETVVGPWHPEVAVSLNNLALLHQERGRYQAADPLLQRALAIHEKARGPNHLDVALSLNNLATLYLHSEAYGEAEPLLQRALVIHEKNLGPNHPRVAVCLSNLASLYHQQGAYRQAEPLLQRALVIQEKTLGPDHSDVGVSLNNLASLYNAQGKYRQAAPLFERALAIRENVLGPDHSDVAMSLNSLASLHVVQGVYEEAEPLLARALAIHEKTLGPNHTRVATTLTSLASLYSAQGAYKKAEPLLARALDIHEKSVGPNHHRTAISLTNLASLYVHLGSRDRAELLLKRALVIHEATATPDHHHIAHSLSNLASLYSAQGAYGRAVPLLERALAIHERTLGPDHPSVAQSLNNLAWLYESQRAYEKAQPLFERALAIREKVLGPDHVLVASSFDNLAVLYDEQGRNDLALELHSRAFDIQEANVLRTLVVADESRKLSYSSSLSWQLNYVLSLHLQTNSEHDAIADLALTTLLRRKNRVQDLVAQSSAALRRSLSENDLHLLDDIMDVDSRIAVLSNRGPDKIGIEAHSQQLDELGRERDRLWSDLAKYINTVEALNHSITIKGVQVTLSPGNVLIEFVRYLPQHDNDGIRVREHEPKPKPRYAAYLLLPDRFDWVDLGPAAPIDEHVRAFRTALQTKQAIPTDLHDAVMRPIIEKLGSTQRLIIAPAGALSLVPFGALHDGNHYLIEKYDLRYVTTGRDLLAPPASPPVTTTPVTVVANPTGAFLPDAEIEADFLEGFFPDTRVLRSDQATETNVRTVERPLILHMATHGFFGEARNERDNPMFRSGLHLADIEQVEVDRELDDGQLTAYEVSGMDLRGTQLVVLSACDTGMGGAVMAEGKELMSEGVSGLRRAFAMAGARTTVMSLWAVSGVTAQTTMEAYYRKLAAGQGPGEAMQAVQLEMLRTKEHAHPKDWAVFIVSGDDDPLDFPAGQEPRETETPPLDEGPPPVRRLRGCAMAAPVPDRDPSVPAFLLALFGLGVLRRRRA